MHVAGKERLGGSQVVVSAGHACLRWMFDVRGGESVMGWVHL
jgi:hypothetical protein